MWVRTCRDGVGVECECWLMGKSCKWSVGCAGQAMQLSEGQREAIRTAARSPVCVVTGGPGCGKTTTTRYIVSLWAAMNKRLAICAPTGDTPYCRPPLPSPLPPGDPGNLHVHSASVYPTCCCTAYELKAAHSQSPSEGGQIFGQTAI